MGRRHVDCAHGWRAVARCLSRKLSPAAPKRAVIGPHGKGVGRAARTKHVAHLRQVGRRNIDLGIGGLDDAVDDPVAVTLCVQERILGDGIAICVRHGEEAGRQHRGLARACMDVGR